MTENTDAHWRKWGKTDPYYAVLSHEKFRKANLAANSREFFDSGFAQADQVLAVLRRHYGIVKLDTALDFGCGVGRVLVGLARHYKNVVGIDVSEDMLEEARHNLQRFGVGNAHLTQSDDHLSNIDTKFDLIHTYIVLQHIPVRRGETIIRAMLDRLKPDGAIALHVSLRRNLSLARRLFYVIHHRVPMARYALNMLRGRPWNDPLVQMNQYDLVAILDLFAERGMRDLIVMPERHGRYSTAMIYGRRSIARVV